MLEKSPSARPSASQLLHSTWIEPISDKHGQGQDDCIEEGEPPLVAIETVAAPLDNHLSSDVIEEDRTALEPLSEPELRPELLEDSGDNSAILTQARLDAWQILQQSNTGECKRDATIRKVDLIDEDEGERAEETLFTSTTEARLLAWQNLHQSNIGSLPARMAVK